MQPPNNIEYAFVVYEDMKIESSINMKEPVYSALIRCCSINNRPDNALLLFNDMINNNIAPKLRTLHPLLTVLSQSDNNNHITMCYQLFTDMINKYNLSPSEREYVIMLKLSIETNNKEKFYNILHDMMEELLVPIQSEVWNILIEWFSKNCIDENYIITESEIDNKGYTIIIDFFNYNGIYFKYKSIIVLVIAGVVVEMIMMIIMRSYISVVINLVSVVIIAEVKLVIVVLVLVVVVVAVVVVVLLLPYHYYFHYYYH